ncbi:hypothetical protein ACIPJ2_03810 [Curtobacterium sp. NPDC090217]|uniref:hypothetical protein n=1 Tax=Curtobacterium sp. NPDC090217 TaxID=3363970 RepID=UPI003817283A
MIPLLLRAPVVVRIGNSMAGLALGLCAVAVLASTVPTWWGDAEFAVASSPVAAAVGYLVVRAWRLGVRCEPDVLVVRGWLWSRRIPCSAVTDVPRDPAGTLFALGVTWRHGGRRRWTPLTAFWVSSDPFGLVSPAAEDALRLLRLWSAPVDDR